MICDPRKIILYLLLEIFCFVYSSPSFKNLEKIQKDVEKINSLQFLWKAEINYFSKLSDENVRARMGSMMRPKKAAPDDGWQVGLPVEPAAGSKGKWIPPSFDSRKHWPRCKVIRDIKDQSVCGGCWAVASAAAFSGRNCIASGQKINVDYSAYDLLGCCGRCKEGGLNGDGCAGGHVDEAFNFIRENGVCSGGNYGSTNTCKPYPFAPCSSPDRKCSKASSNQCQHKCTNKRYKTSYEKDKRYGGPAYRMENISVVQYDLMKNGPLVAIFRTCDDFLHYKSGVYFHVIGGCKSFYHAVVLLGWGTENGVEYWLAANTWNSSWGDKGTFKIHQTENNCDFGYFTASKVAAKTMDGL